MHQKDDYIEDKSNTSLVTVKSVISLTSLTLVCGVMIYLWRNGNLTTQFLFSSFNSLKNLGEQAKSTTINAFKEPAFSAPVVSALVSAVVVPTISGGFSFFATRTLKNQEQEKIKVLTQISEIEHDFNAGMQALTERDYYNAAKSFEKVVNFIPPKKLFDNTEKFKKISSEACYYQAKALFFMGNYDESLKQITITNQNKDTKIANRIISQHRKDCLNLAGLTYFKQEAWDKAVTFFEQSIKLYSAQNDIYLLLQYAYAKKKEEQKEDAISFYKKIVRHISLPPTENIITNELTEIYGFSLLKIANLENSCDAFIEAAAALETAIQLTPINPNFFKEKSRLLCGCVEIYTCLKEKWNWKNKSSFSVTLLLENLPREEKVIKIDQREITNKMSKYEEKLQELKNDFEEHKNLLQKTASEPTRRLSSSKCTVQ